MTKPVVLNCGPIGVTTSGCLVLVELKTPEEAHDLFSAFSIAIEAKRDPFGLQNRLEKENGIVPLESQED